MRNEYGRFGFMSEAGKIYLVRCPKCDPEWGRENWAPAVATGQCAWCGFKPEPKDMEKFSEKKKV